MKTYQAELLQESGLPRQYAEEFYSVSGKSVLRGLHFQLPPMAQGKIVYCVEGEVLDAVVDLRLGSPTYRQYDIFALSGENGHIVCIPEGLAHGFFVLSDSAIMMYKVTAGYSPAHDAGILWSSCGIPWPSPEPILSERDRSFPALEEFRSPFRYASPRVR